MPFTSSIKNICRPFKHETKGVSLKLHFFLALFFLLNTDKIFGQEINKKTFHYGFGLEYYVTGSGHGGFYSGYLSMSKGKSAFSLGPVVQKRSLKFGGARLGFTYKIAGLDDEDKSLNTGRVGLKFFSYLQYVDLLPLSYSAENSETTVHVNSQMDWNGIKLSTLEGGAGIEIHIRIAKAITWKNYVGLAGFYHFNYVSGMYNDRSGPAIIFGTGINIPRLKM